MVEWGLLPHDVRAQLQRKEWDSTTNLRERMLGQRSFPLRVALKVPTGAQALRKIDHFHEFIKQWRQWPDEGQIEWAQKQYRELGTHSVPLILTLENMQALIEFIGPKAVARSGHWEGVMSPILKFNSNLYPVLVRHLMTLENLRVGEAELIANLLPQLHKDIGRGSYLRALPLKGVDTKFLENHFTLVTDLLDVHFEGQICQAEGLMNWLGCLEVPRAWLLVRPLCTKTKAHLCGLPILQLCTQSLRDKPLPANNILIVENTQPGYGLPPLRDTIAVFGGGANTSWMDAQWLQGKNIGYWGDIDTWGFSFLSEARRNQPGLDPLMMDRQTLTRYQHRMCQEPTPCDKLPSNLTAVEIELFEELRQGHYGDTRLEQERISSNYIQDQLLDWAG